MYRTPRVMAQVFNSGAGQTAPFLISIHAVDPTGFDYYLVNPASESRSAYTASIHFAATCHDTRERLLEAVVVAPRQSP